MALNSQQQSALASALESKGYSHTDAQNAAANAGGRADSLYNEYIGSNSTGGGGGNGGNVDSAMAELRKAIEVSTGALKGQQELLPQQTAQRKTELQQQQSNLEARYANLLAEVKGQTEQAVNRTTGTTRQELANRGINVEGNLGQTEVNAAVNPLNMEAGRQLQSLGLSRESDLATITNAINKLPLEEQQMYLQLQQAIGAAQTSGNTTALQYAMQQAKQLQDAAIAQQNYELALTTQEQNAALNAANIKNIESQIANRGSSTGGMTAAEIKQLQDLGLLPKPGTTTTGTPAPTPGFVPLTTGSGVSAGMSVNPATTAGGMSVPYTNYQLNTDPNSKQIYPTKYGFNLIK